MAQQNRLSLPQESPESYRIPDLMSPGASLAPFVLGFCPGSESPRVGGVGASFSGVSGNHLVTSAETTAPKSNPAGQPRPAPRPQGLTLPPTRAASALNGAGVRCAPCGERSHTCHPEPAARLELAGPRRLPGASPSSARQAQKWRQSVI